MFEKGTSTITVLYGSGETDSGEIRDLSTPVDSGRKRDLY